MESPEMIRVHSRRTNYFVDKKFQTNFIVKFCLVVIAAGLLIMLALFILTRKATTVSFVNSRVIVQSTADFLFPVLLQTVIVTTIIAGLATIFITLFISHKIAGPIYRFKKVLAALSEGDFSIGCKIRRTDSLQDVAAAFSDMITSVNSGFKSTEYSLNRLEEKIKALNLKDKESPEIKELREIVLELDKALHYFKF